MTTALTDHFPLYGLRITTPRLELRLPNLDELAGLGEVAADGVHDPDYMPFTVPWSIRPPAERALSVMQNHWETLSRVGPARWNLPLTVFFDGEPVGQQNLGGRDVAITREVVSGSWLGQRFHGKGIGTEMRAGMLHLAFEGLGLERARSAGYEDNAPSLAISRKLGYIDDGVERDAVLGGLKITKRLSLTRQAWERHRTVPVELAGVEPCLPLLGLA